MQAIFSSFPKPLAKRTVNLFNGVIANENCIYLIGRLHKASKKDADIKKPVFIYNRDAEPDKQFQLVTTLEGYKTIRGNMSYIPEQQCILYDNAGKQCAINAMQQVVDESANSSGALMKARCIDRQLFAASTMRTIYRRDAAGMLQEITEDMYQDFLTYDKPLDEDGFPSLMTVVIEDGFDDIDGFDANDLYAVGGRGDVWRFADEMWIKCGFPSNVSFKNICCGGDGLVYVSGVGGITYVGREDNWTELEDPDLSLPFKNMVWYEGKVWATNDWGVWWITPDGIIKADVPDEVYCCSGKLHANAGMLLLVGINGAALHVDGEWELII